jgi:cytochrome c biogenesis protein CcmG/thiol:disulfide interchange protein DsbE
VRVALALLAAGLLAAGCTSDSTPEHATPPTAGIVVLPGCPAEQVQSTSPTALPDITLPCLGGAGANEIPLRRLTGLPTVLNLWASWCAPCRQELPAFVRLQQAAGSQPARRSAATGPQPAPRKLQVIGVASKDVPGRAVEFAGETKLPFPSLQDENGDLLRALRRVGLPVTVLLTADGSVADVYQGAPLTDTTLRALVKDKLGVDV